MFDLIEKRTVIALKRKPLLQASAHDSWMIT